MSWKKRIPYHPTSVLIGSESTALRYFAERDLAESEPGPIEELWSLPAVARLVGVQQENGSWRYHGGRPDLRSSEDYDQLETYRMLRILVEQYGLNKDHPSLRRASEFMFSHQTDQGDFRGILGKQYVPYYSAAIMELLIKAGYEEDPRIRRSFRWLTSMRQYDGGWAFPIRTVGLKLGPETFNSGPVEPDRRKPFSHMVTGIVLRAFAAHPSYRTSREARFAGELLADRFFEADKYSDRKAPSFWTSFSFPFWFTDLLSALDSLALIRTDVGNTQIQRGLEWFISRQKKSGLWNLPLRIMAKEKEPHQWITLAICRVFKRFYG